MLTYHGLNSRIRSQTRTPSPSTPFQTWHHLLSWFPGRQMRHSLSLTSWLRLCRRCYLEHEKLRETPTTIYTFETWLNVERWLFLWNGSAHTSILGDERLTNRGCWRIEADVFVGLTWSTLEAQHQDCWVAPLPKTRHSTYLGFKLQLFIPCFCVPIERSQRLESLSRNISSILSLRYTTLEVLNTCFEVHRLLFWCYLNIEKYDCVYNDWYM